ncbi:MAG: hypothetical protein LC649_10340 [Bacteroidales bacterium]|nr:hypothetical protein [Bacteroidales bacterium]
MLRKVFIIILFAVSAAGIDAQSLIRAEAIIGERDGGSNGRVEISQDIRIDSLLTRHIKANREYGGLDGYRIQIYRGSARNARAEAMKVIAEFISGFPGIESELQFDQPNLFKVRVGNYRTKHEAYIDFVNIKKRFPEAYIVNDIIDFPSLEK